MLQVGQVRPVRLAMPSASATFGSLFGELTTAHAVELTKHCTCCCIELTFDLCCTAEVTLGVTECTAPGASARHSSSTGPLPLVCQSKQAHPTTASDETSNGSATMCCLLGAEEPRREEVSERTTISSTLHNTVWAILKCFENFENLAPNLNWVG
eukprot:3361334-Rhodomonas_salina.3